ncbi:AAA family ATPase [Leekyejoonella antrihumi]|uniref:VWA domain-containing protein n=1 Tax=Leekyejoonella antrihumi TaxID=1660198 RepID=A0A563DX04_9MICO|nr:AAA family ATPase [Leekyejoonella antrihumi]TWP34224.1 VWA domain-containing protein [Leekyejoonella antrihumi]
MTDHAVIGRAPEAELLEAALDAGAHVVLEGPPGTGKSTLLRAVAYMRDVGFAFVEGNTELTPARMLGHFDPALVLARGYSPDVFVDGPLLEAMRAGTLLYVEELNRVPEETLNVLLTAMSEREVTVPRLGRVAAAAGFRLVAAMNPYDPVGTARISGALADRTCRISMGYQSAASEVEIVLHATEDAPAPDWIGRVVALVRATREHPELRVGSSVRGAIDIARVAGALARRRHCDLAAAGLDAALVSLTGRIQVATTSHRTATEIITDLYEQHFAPAAGDSSPGDDPPGKDAACPPSSKGSSRQADNARRPRPRSRPEDRMVSRSELSLSPAFDKVSPEVGQVDEDALREALSDDVQGTVTLMARMLRATDPALRKAAERLSAGLLFDRVMRAAPDRGGVHRRTRSQGRTDGDLDLDASLDQIVAAGVEGRPASLDELVVSHWARSTLALVLVIDRSGSMTGPSLANASVLAAACALRMPDEFAVLAFARDVTVLRDLRDVAPGAVVVDRVLRLVGHGETGLRHALTRAAAALTTATSSRRVVVLLSDCRAGGHDEDGVDSVARAASALDELLILAPAGDCEQAHALARRAGARCSELSTVQDGPAALGDLLTAPTW